MHETEERRRDRGAVLPIVALTLGVLILSAALAVDIGRQMLQRRDLQKVADAIAFDMARVLDGNPPNAYNTVGGARKSGWDAALAASAARNDFTPGGSKILTAEAGCYDQITQVFDTNNSTCSVATAARVIATNSFNYAFYIGSGTSTRTGIASLDGTLDYQVGSFLAGTSPDAGQVNLLNAVLGRALGSSNPLTLTAVGYSGLADASITARQISTQMGLASPDELFTGSVNARNFFNATADVLQNNGASAATVSAARSWATTVGATTQFDFSAVADPGGSISGSSGSGSVFDTSFNVLNMLQGAAFVINGTNALSIPGLSLNVPNLGTVDIGLTVIEAPRILFDQRVGWTATTSQVHLTLTSQINQDASAILAGARLTGSITVDLSAAGATAYPTAINCANPTSQSASIGLDAQPLTVTASESLTLAAQVLFSTINVANVNVTGATVSTTSGGGTGDFDYTAEFLPPIGTGTTQRLGSSTLNLSGALAASTSNTTVLSIAIPVATLVNTVNTVLQATTLPAITNVLLPKVTKTLGLYLGGGDVGAIDMDCDSLKLVG